VDASASSKSFGASSNSLTNRGNVLTKKSNGTVQKLKFLKRKLKLKQRLNAGTRKLQNEIENGLQQLKLSVKYSLMHQELILALMNLINLSFYDACPDNLGNVVTIIVEQLAQEWKANLHEDAHHGGFSEVIGSAVASTGSALEHRFSVVSSAVARTGRLAKKIVPENVQHGLQTAVHEAERAVVKIEPPWATKCLQQLCNKAARHRTLRFLDDWRVMLFVISLVFLAVITGFLAPVEHPPFVFPAIDISCAAIFW
jgi:hypothetical protein